MEFQDERKLVTRRMLILMNDPCGVKRTKTSWEAMIRRCYKNDYHWFKNYGGRGIKVCEDWLNFNFFLRDMGIRPMGTTLDRIDNNGNYQLDNCRWATKLEQDNNRRTNKFITFNGITKTLEDWSRTLNINANTLFYRLKRGWSILEAFTIPKTDRWHGRWGRKNGRQ